MSGNNYKIVFGEVKAKVGIDDVAYSLGYALNKRAGVGKYFELVLGPASKPIDTIVVHNVDKAQQTFFRRNGSKGDVVTFIRENLTSFNAPGNDDWTKVANVLAKFANMPTVDYSDRQYVSKSKTQQQFNPERYDVRQISGEKVPYILYKRGFSAECVKDFGDSVKLIRDLNLTSFDGYNIGFPYRHADSGRVTGYEIRGNGGFKSKAAGTQSSNSFWSADFGADSPQAVRNVYLFESSFDAMAFYQLNKAKIAMSPFAVVSTGGAFTESQVQMVMKKYPAARLVDCFDNDLAGNVYSANLVKHAEKKDLQVSCTENAAGERTMHLSYKNRTVECPANDFSFKDAAKEIGLNYETGHWKAPKNYKDWNDSLLGNQIKNTVTPSKYERDRNLAEKRKSSFKM